VTGMVILQKALQAAGKVLGAGKAATGQKATGQHAKEPLGLIEPRAVLRREMKDMTVIRVAQKGPALRSLLKRMGLKGHLAPVGHHAADVQTPVGVSVVHHPVITRHAGQVLLCLFEMGHAIGGRAGASQGPGHLAGGYGQSIDQHARAVANVCMVASLATARLGRLGGGCACEHVHAGFLVAADQHTVLLGGHKRFGIPLTDMVGFDIKVLIVAVEPVRTLVGFEINVLKETPEA
jgi:hypothetical protein